MSISDDVENVTCPERLHTQTVRQGGREQVGTASEAGCTMAANPVSKKAIPQSCCAFAQFFNLRRHT